MTQSIALITNATQFAGPPGVAALLDYGLRVFVHDRSFCSPSDRDRYATTHVGAHVLAAQSPEDLIEELLSHTGRLDAVVSNDAYPAVVSPIERADPEELTQTLHALVGFPYRLIRSALPALRRSKQPRVVFITSNRTRLPVPGGAIPDAARAAANALVKSLSVEFAPLGIPVNAVAPNFLYSETYYPRSEFVDSQRGREFVSTHVPVRRLGDPSEIGEVIGFLATATSTFMTGSIIDFSGGWPSGSTLVRESSSARTNK